MDLWLVLIAAGAAIATLALVVAGGQMLLRHRAMHARTERVLAFGPATADAAGGGRPPGPLVRWGRWAAAQRASAALGLVAVLLLVAGLARLAWSLVLPLVVACAAGIVWLVFQRKRERRALLEAQLVLALQLMASAMESGSSVPQALARVANDAPEPIAAEFAQLLHAIELGQPLQSALDALAARTHSASFYFFATVLAVQHRVGGDLPGLLNNLAGTIRDRLELQAELRALTAQARFSGWVLAALPFVVVGMMLLASPGYVSPLFNTEPGRVLLLIALVLLGVGLLSIRMLNRVEV